MSRATEIEAAFRELVYPGSRIFEPFEVTDVEYDIETGASSNADATLTLLYDGREYRFAVEVSPRTAPSVTSRAIDHLMNVASENDPLLIAPFLTDELVTMLKKAGISGADLAGNYRFSTEALVAVRRDRPNVFPEGTGIRNIYRGVSSIVSRFLLSRPGEYESVNSVHEGILQCGAEISLATVSKVLASLQDDLLIEKTRRRIRVLQASGLLDKLAENYSPPTLAHGPFHWRINDQVTDREELVSRVVGTFEWIWDGSTSAALYLDIAGPRVPVVLVQAVEFMSHEVIPGVAEPVPSELAERDNRFPDLAIGYTKDREPFFRCESDGHRASMLEAYLSWSNLDKRERELADPLRRRILSSF